MYDVFCVLFTKQLITTLVAAFQDILCCSSFSYYKTLPTIFSVTFEILPYSVDNQERTDDIHSSLS